MALVSPFPWKLFPFFYGVWFVFLYTLFVFRCLVLIFVCRIVFHPLSVYSFLLRSHPFLHPGPAVHNLGLTSNDVNRLTSGAPLSSPLFPPPHSIFITRLPQMELSGVTFRQQSPSFLSIYSMFPDLRSSWRLSRPGAHGAPGAELIIFSPFGEK